MLYEVITYRDHPVEIDLAIRVGDSGDRFTVDLRGRLADEGSSADFSINKRYFGSSRASVMNAFNVITSYSIHYTKLYEPRAGLDQASNA